MKVKIYEKINKEGGRPPKFKNAKNGGFLLKFFENRRFLVVEKRYFKISEFQRILRKSPNFKKCFCIFELTRPFSMFADFFINFDLKKWVTAIWKFQRCTSLLHICCKLVQSQNFWTAINQSFLSKNLWKNHDDWEIWSFLFFHFLANSGSWAIYPCPF